LPAEARIDGGGGSAQDAHFFIALCSRAQLPAPKSFVYVPKAANMLREREQHVEALERQLGDIKADRQTLLELFRQQTRDLEERNLWAQRLDADLQAAGERILALQNELAELTAGYQAQFERMEEQNQIKTAWALKASADLEAKCQELADCVGLLDAANTTVRERTVWAQTAEAQRSELAARLEMIRDSRWVKMGRTVGLGPDLSK
jgi:chromosome segregation ATPase